jgi:hypothetical protein
MEGIRMPFLRVLAIALVLSITQVAVAMTREQRREYRDKLVSILPDVPAFNAWLSETDELPPDFDALPDPLTFFDRRPAHSPLEIQPLSATTSVASGTSGSCRSMHQC